jgi:hypothetical protein
MSKPASYYDWEKSFIKSKSKTQKIKIIDKPLGIPTNIYREFIEKWKKKNLCS